MNNQGSKVQGLNKIQVNTFQKKQLIVNKKINKKQFKLQLNIKYKRKKMMKQYHNKKNALNQIIN